MTATREVTCSIAFVEQQLSTRQVLIEQIEYRVFSLSGPELKRMVSNEDEAKIYREIARILLMFLPDELHETPMEVKYNAKAKSMSYRFLEPA